MRIQNRMSFKPVIGFVKKNLLFLILLSAFLLRFLGLAHYPEAIDEDEMALGYYAYSIVHGGTDEYGNKFPIYFKSVGDYKYGLYSYVAAIPVGIFGLNTVTARIISVISGTFSIYAIYLLANLLFKSKKYALLSAFVLAISPTHIHFSRIAYNNVLGATLAIFSIVFFIKYLKKDGTDKRNDLLTLVFFTLSIFSYQAYRIFLPITFVSIFCIYFKEIDKKQVFKKSLLLIFSILIVLVSFVPNVSRVRASGATSLMEKPQLLEKISEDGYVRPPIVFTRALHNKISSLGTGFIKRYVSYFDPKFLFVETSSGDERHSIPGMGLLYMIEGVLVLFGFLALGSVIKGKEKFIPLIIIFSAPIAASMVLDSTSVTRSVISVYGYSLVIALGIYYLSIQKRYGNIVLIGVLCLYFFSFLNFVDEYTIHKIYHHPWNNDFGLKEMVEGVNRYKSNYSSVVVSAGHYIPFLFYNHEDPKTFIRNSIPVNTGGIEKFGNIYFNMPEKCPLAGKNGVLYICFGYQVPKGGHVINTIYYRDRQPAIFFVEFTGNINDKALPERLEYFKYVDDRFPNGILPDNYATFWPKKGI